MMNAEFVIPQNNFNIIAEYADNAIKEIEK
jgi:hypothetical protein